MIGEPSLAPAGPFWKRVYGSYSSTQVKRASEVLSGLSRPVLDPMCGSAGQLPAIITQGLSVVGWELNPAVCALARLRVPVATGVRQTVRRLLRSVLSRRRWRLRAEPGVFVDGWLSNASAELLREFRSRVRLVCGDRDESNRRPSEILCAMPILAARSIALHSESDNISWLKPGGIQREVDLREVLRASLEAWIDWQARRFDSVPVTSAGRLDVSVADARSAVLSAPPGGILWSPPYANRLDYTRLWGPEGAVHEAIEGRSCMAEVRDSSVGTNSIGSWRPSPGDLSVLPSVVRVALDAIRTDSAKASDSYYFPFFAKYALDLHAAASNIERQLGADSRGIVFVRDTPRKDVLFPTTELIVHVFRKPGRRVYVEETVIRGHIGLRRRGSHRSLQGLAQRETAIVWGVA